MPVIVNNRLSYFAIDAKNAAVTERIERENVYVGDSFEGVVNRLRIEEWEYENEKRYTVKVLFGVTECLTFSAQTTFARMVIARMLHYHRNVGDIRGRVVRLTPYKYEDTCCGAIRVEGDKYAKAVELPKTVTVKVGNKEVLDDSQVIAFLTNAIQEMSSAGTGSEESVGTEDVQR